MNPTPPPAYPKAHGLLEGRTVLVTAAAGTGIGFSTAKRCAEEGAKAVVISDIHERRLAEAVEAIEKDTGLRPKSILCNVSKEDEVQRMFDFAIAEECGRWRECGRYRAVYGDAVIAIEYRRRDFRRACARVGARVSVVLRDRLVSTPSQRRYVYDAC